MADLFVQPRTTGPGFIQRASVDTSAGVAQAGRVAALGADGVLHESLSGTVLRQNISGAASVSVAAHTALELTLTANVTSLTFTGWRAINTILQRTLVRIVQDATGGRTFDWTALTGIWVETPPQTWQLDTTPNALTLQFWATTIDGGTTVLLEPIGVTYTNNSTPLEMIELPVPAVTALGSLEFTHGFLTVCDAVLVNQATGRKVDTDWYLSVVGIESSPIVVDFDEAHTAGTYRIRIWGVPSRPQTIALSSDLWESTDLSLNNAASMVITTTHDGGATDVQWRFPDGTTAFAPSGTAVTKNFTPNLTGTVTLRWRPGTAIFGFDSSSPWSFSLADMPRTVTGFFLQGDGIHGNWSDLPSGANYIYIAGNARIQGRYLPRADLVKFVYQPDNIDIPARWVDQVLADINALGTTNSSGDTPHIQLTGANTEGPSPAGLASRTALQGRSWVVSVNTAPASTLGVVTPTTGAGTGPAIANRLSTGQILFFSSCDVPAGYTSGLKPHPDWVAAHYNGSDIQPDGTESYGFSFPNGPAGGNLWDFRTDVRSLSGGGLLHTQVTNGYEQPNAAQFHRIVDRFGRTFPNEFYISAWYYFPQTISFTNTVTTGPNTGSFGFTNMMQVKGRVAGSSLPEIGIGAEMNTTNGDAFMRWRAASYGTGSFVQIPQIGAPYQIPLNTWTHLEARVLLAQSAAGAVQVWADGRLIAEGFLQTERTGSDARDISWNLYGLAMSPTNPILLIEDCLISTVPVHQLLFP